MQEISVERLGIADVQRARALFTAMAEVFETDGGPLSDGYLAKLLGRDDFWAMAATLDRQIVGGLTAYTLALTRAEQSEIFLYDIAVRPEYQRRGVGRRLVETLREQAAAEGITVTFVPADNEDGHALDFYRALGGVAQPVTIFTWSDADDGS